MVVRAPGISEANILFLKAEEKLKQRNYEAAETLYKRILNKQPEHSLALTHYANLLYKMKDFDTSQDLFLKSLNVNPLHPHTLNCYAVFLETCMRDTKKAQEFYEKSIQVDPHNADSLYNFAIFKDVALKEFDSAEQLYQRCLSEDPSHLGCLGNYAMFLYSVRKDTTNAENHFLKALDVAKAEGKGSYKYWLCKYDLFLKKVRKKKQLEQMELIEEGKLLAEGINPSQEALQKGRKSEIASSRVSSVGEEETQKAYCEKKGLNCTSAKEAEEMEDEGALLSPGESAFLTQFLEKLFLPTRSNLENSIAHKRSGSASQALPTILPSDMEFSRIKRMLSRQDTRNHFARLLNIQRSKVDPHCAFGGGENIPSKIHHLSWLQQWVSLESAAFRMLCEAVEAAMRHANRERDYTNAKRYHVAKDSLQVFLLNYSIQADANGGHLSSLCVTRKCE